MAAPGSHGAQCWWWEVESVVESNQILQPIAGNRRWVLLFATDAPATKMKTATTKPALWLVVAAFAAGGWLI